MKRIVSACVLPILIITFLCSCSRDILVNISDLGKTQTLQSKTGTAVYEVLESNGITINEKDEISPPLDSVITEKSRDISILRYAKVTVIRENESKEVELVGGTVKDAVEESGFELDENESPDHDENEYLTDGMKINILKKKTVTIKVDGKSQEIITKASTVEELLKEQNIKLGEFDEISEDADTQLEDDIIITIYRIEYKEETHTESIDFETIEKYDDSMYKGESKITQEGSKGEKEVIYKVKYIDGKEDSKEKISEKTTKEPEDEIIVYGTKSNILTQDEAMEIVKEYKSWKKYLENNDPPCIVQPQPQKHEEDPEHHYFILKWLVENSYYSAIDYKKVNVYTGEVTDW